MRSTRMRSYCARKAGVTTRGLFCSSVRVTAEPCSSSQASKLAFGAKPDPPDADRQAVADPVAADVDVVDRVVAVVGDQVARHLDLLRRHAVDVAGRVARVLDSSLVVRPSCSCRSSPPSVVLVPPVVPTSVVESTPSVPVVDVTARSSRSRRARAGRRVRGRAEAEPVPEPVSVSSPEVVGLLALEVVGVWSLVLRRGGCRGGTRVGRRSPPGEQPAIVSQRPAVSRT